MLPHVSSMQLAFARIKESWEEAYLTNLATHPLASVLDRIRIGTEVERATWDAERSRWVLQTSAGDHEADVLITACGQLSVPAVPPIPGLDDFDGPAFHTARWRHDIDLAGRRVAVVGTGCSAIQVVPAIQPIVAHVDVYQRSPGWTFPRMDFAYSERAKRLFARFPSLQRLDRRANFAFHELGAMDFHRWQRPEFAGEFFGFHRERFFGGFAADQFRRQTGDSDGRFAAERLERRPVNDLFAVLLFEFHPQPQHLAAIRVADRADGIRARHLTHVLWIGERRLNSFLQVFVHGK